MFLYFSQISGFQAKRHRILGEKSRHLCRSSLPIPPFIAQASISGEKKWVFISPKVFAFSITTFGHPLENIQQGYQNCNPQCRAKVCGKMFSSRKPCLLNLSKCELQNSRFQWNVSPGLSKLHCRAQWNILRINWFSEGNLVFFSLFELGVNFRFGSIHNCLQDSSKLHSWFALNVMGKIFFFRSSLTSSQVSIFERKIIRLMTLVKQSCQNCVPLVQKIVF